jgi:hypothetical protein
MTTNDNTNDPNLRDLDAAIKEAVPAWKQGRQGPWNDEADHKRWYHMGILCEISRPVPELGHWCGYVLLPEDHPWHGKCYDDIDVDYVHGGLTYVGTANDEELGNLNLWRIGFDCAHAGDLVPGSKSSYDGDVYRTQDYVTRETEKLAELAHQAVTYAAMMEDAERWPKGEGPTLPPPISDRDFDIIWDAQQAVTTRQDAVRRTRRSVLGLSSALTLDEVPPETRFALFDLLVDLTEDLREAEEELLAAKAALEVVTPR